MNALARLPALLTAIAVAALVACQEQGPRGADRIRIDVPSTSVVVGTMSSTGWLEVRGRIPSPELAATLGYEVDQGGDVPVDFAAGTGEFVAVIESLGLGAHVIRFRMTDIEGRTHAAPDIQVLVVPAVREIPIDADVGDAFPTAINEAGDVTGYVFAADAPTFRAFGYVAGNLQPLGDAGDFRSIATDINDARVIVGYSIAAQDALPEAFRWESGAASPVLQVPGAAVALNTDGVITGSAYPESGPPRGFVRAGGAPSYFGDVGRFTGGVDVNALGAVIATSQGTGGHATTFVFANGQSVPIGSLGGQRTLGRALNDSGHATGYAEPPDRSTYRAFRATGAGSDELRHVDSIDASSFGYDLNARSVVVGEMITAGEAGPEHWAFIAAGTALVTLESRLGAGAPPLLGAYAISNRGEIAAVALTANGLRPVIIALPGGPEAMSSALQPASPTTRMQSHGPDVSQSLDAHRTRGEP